MRKYKLDNKAKKDEDPSKYKDFGKLVTNYESTLKRVHKKPLYKDPKAFLALLVFILILILVLKSDEESTPPEPAQQEQPLPDNSGNP